MNQDERIDGVLKALTTAEPPHGMEDRILRRLPERQPKAHAGQRWFVRVATFATVAVLALVVALHHRVQLPVAARHIAKAIEVPSVPNVETHVSEARSRTLRATHIRAIAPKHENEISFPAPPAPLSDQEKLLVKLAQARNREATRDVVVANARDTKEVGLTHEEALLVAVSRVRQDAVIEALDPVRRAEADARAKQEFNKFVHEKDGGS